MDYHTCTHEVRSYELDRYNHVNNAAYLNYLEYGRICFLRDYNFNYRKFVDSGFSLFVTHISISYKRPSGLGDILTICTIPIKKRLTGGTFRQIIKKEGVLICEAEVSWASINGEGKPCRIPEEYEFPELFPAGDSKSPRTE